MSRRPLRPRQKRDLPNPDYKYDSVLVSRFINKLNFRGKKSLAQRIFYTALEMLKEKVGVPDSLKAFLQAIENVKPLVEVKPRRIGGATYQVPVEVTKLRGENLAIRWVIQYAQERKGIPMSKKLCEELAAAYKKEGSSIKKRDDTHKMADANKAFAHYRW
jgi:small subunit ribosomal protein S7